MPENAQVRTDSDRDRRQFLQVALSESVEQSGGNFNKPSVILPTLAN
jgi:hypothetical protein